jgi:very-short-patch-repair endonuclease
VLSHFAAAVFWGFWTWEGGLVDVTIPGGTRAIDGIRVHRSRTLESVARLHPDGRATSPPRTIERDVRVRHGIRVTSSARTLLDLATVLPEKTLRRMARRAQAQRAVSIPQILELLRRSNGHHGAERLRAVIADGPAPTRSDLEDRLLDLLDEARIERPEINAPLRFGDETITPDYLWRARRVAIEADSVTWHDHKLTRERDADKQARLEAAGLRVVRITHRQITRSPQQTLARIRAALG